MLTAAALVPDTALLVPGVAGRSTDPLAGLREAAVAAVGRVVGSGARRLVVVAPGARTRILDEPLRGSLAAAGVPDVLLGWPVPGPPGAPVPSVPSAVALHLIAHVERSRAQGRPESDEGTPDDLPVMVVEVAPDEPAARLRGLGAELAADVPTACVVVGSLSARHGPDAPLADDARAPAFDAALLADLVDAGPDALARLGAVPSEQAGALAVTGWAPWQVLLGMTAGARLHGDLLASGVPGGAAHAVVLWVPIASGASASEGLQVPSSATTASGASASAAGGAA